MPLSSFFLVSDIWDKTVTSCLSEVPEASATNSYQVPASRNWCQIICLPPLCMCPKHLLWLCSPEQFITDVYPSPSETHLPFGPVRFGVAAVLLIAPHNQQGKSIARLLCSSSGESPFTRVWFSLCLRELTPVFPMQMLQAQSRVLCWRRAVCSHLELQPHGRGN